MGTDITIKTADIILSSWKLSNVPQAIRLSRAVIRNIKQKPIELKLCERGDQRLKIETIQNQRMKGNTHEEDYNAY